MELKVFPVPAVAELLERMVEARIHNDGANQNEIRKMQDDMIHTGATPSYALIDPETGALIDQHEGPQLDAKLFAAWLRQAESKWKAL